MSDLPLRWTDTFTSPASLNPHWVGGHANPSREATFLVQNGLHLRFEAGTEYASVGVVTRQAIVGDLDARVRFEVQSPQAGTTFELAAISIDPPRESALDQSEANEWTRSLVYDVHGAPPYVSSELDENDGWRIGWNRGSAQTRQGPKGTPISDNQYNRYGHSAPHLDGPVSGWLRLVRQGQDWTSYRLDEATQTWVSTGQVLAMNLPDAVFLRLAAKHWVKGSAGNTTAPANAVSFHTFELRTAHPLRGNAPLAPQSPANPPLSPEVRLVQALRRCRQCTGVWQTTPFGPFIQTAPQTQADGTPSAVHQIKAFALPEPAALLGCRKAPVMLVGINPNMKGHFVLPKSASSVGKPSGSLRVLPYLGSDAEYAQHHRQGPHLAMDIDEATLSNLLRPDTSMLVAAKDGEVCSPTNAQDNPTLQSAPGQGSFQVKGQRAARLALKLADGSTPEHNLSWPGTDNLAVVRWQFKAGEEVAGMLDASVVGRSVTPGVTPQLDGYYLRAKALLAQVAKAMNAPNLTLGDDMSLHDAVACASPAWQASLGVPIADMTQHCLDGHNWLGQQVVQSAPAVIVVAGREALGLLLHAAAAGALTPSLSELPTVAGGLQGLFVHSAQHPITWQYGPAPTQRARLIVTPHLSYADSLAPQAYLSEAEWQRFEAQHPTVAHDPEFKSRVKVVFNTSDRAVELPSPFDAHTVPHSPWPTLRQLDATAAQFLQDRWLDPFALLGGAVAQALQEQGIAPDAQGHLMRSKGPCNFCDNPAWRLPGGCSFGVAGQ